MQHIPFQQKYFLAFFKRYGWKWGQVKGTKKYYPKEVIEKEIERINEIMQNYQKQRHKLPKFDLKESRKSNLKVISLIL